MLLTDVSTRVFQVVPVGINLTISVTFRLRYHNSLFPVPRLMLYSEHDSKLKSTLAQ